MESLINRLLSWRFQLWNISDEIKSNETCGLLTSNYRRETDVNKGITRNILDSAVRMTYLKSIEWWKREEHRNRYWVR